MKKHVAKFAICGNISVERVDFVIIDVKHRGQRNGMYVIKKLLYTKKCGAWSEVYQTTGIDLLK